MNFSSVRLVTRNFESLVNFYQAISSAEAIHLADGFAEIHFKNMVLAISDERLIRLYNNGLASAGANHSAILEFEVDDINAVILLAEGRIEGVNVEVAMPITLMPWGNISAILRDPDGTLVNLFTRPAQRT